MTDLNPRTGGCQPIAAAPRNGRDIIIVMDSEAGAYVMRWDPEATNPLFFNATGMWSAPELFMRCEDTDAFDVRGGEAAKLVEGHRVEVIRKPVLHGIAGFRTRVETPSLMAAITRSRRSSDKAAARVLLRDPSIMEP